MPCDSPSLRADVSQRPNFEVPPSEKLGQRVERELACLFEKEIALNRVMEELRQGMQCNKQFHYLKAFQEIDDWAYGYIDAKNLKSFLRKHGYKAENSDVLTIIRRMDLDGDARLNYQEFIDGLTPSEPYSRFLKRLKEKSKPKNLYKDKVNA